VIHPRLANPGKAFRNLLEARQIVVAPGAYDAISARAAEAAGAKAIYLSGAGVTNSLLAVPDIALITLDEMARQANYLCSAVGVPVIADADTGYGETANVMRTVREFERAGLAGLHLEDQVSPKRCGHLDGKQLITSADMVSKLKAAVRARQQPDFMIVARTDARGVNGLADAIERGKRYVDAGADCVFPEGLASADEFAAFREAVPGPLLANMTEFGKTPLITAAEFQRIGYEIVIFPMTAFRAMLFAVSSAYETLIREGTQESILDRMKTRQELYELIEYPAYEALDRELSSGS
jgi:methylisocitrate lyase